MRADRPSGDLFGGIGKPVEIIAGQQEKIHQHRIGRQRHGAEAGADACHQGEGADEHEGADQDVAIEGK